MTELPKKNNPQFEGSTLGARLREVSVKKELAVTNLPVNLSWKFIMFSVSFISGFISTGFRTVKKISG